MKASPEAPGSQYEADDDAKDSKDGKKSRKPTAKLSLSTFAAFEPGGREAKIGGVKPNPNKYTEKLAILATNAPEQAAPEKAAKKTKAVREETVVMSDLELAAAQKPAEIVDNVPSTRNENKWPEEYELSLDDLGGGEFIIRGGKHFAKETALQGDTPQAEAEPGLAPDSAPQPLMRQPEQQHQAQAEQPEPPEPQPAAAGGGSGGNGGETPPPTDPPEGFGAPSEESPEPEPRAYPHFGSSARYHRTTESSRLEPAQAYRRHVQLEAEARALGLDGQRNLTKRNIDKAMRRAGRAGWTGGLLTGLLAGIGYEHAAHERRERKTEKEARKNAKRLNAARQDLKFGRREQERQQTEAGIQLQGAEQRLQGAEKRMEDERRRAQQATAEAKAQSASLPEHRLEVSANNWYATKVDAETGKVVEDLSSPRGREFYNDQAAETMARRRDAVASEAASVAVGASATGSRPAQGNGPAGAAGGGASLPPIIPNATMQGVPPSTQQRPQDPASDTDADPLTNTAPLWPWIVALLVVVVCLIVALS